MSTDELRIPIFECRKDKNFFAFISLGEKLALSILLHPESNAINNFYALIYATLIFKHSDWLLKKLNNQSECFLK